MTALTTTPPSLATRPWPLSMLLPQITRFHFDLVANPILDALGCPATSAGVERMFSKAGKLHDDMKKGQQDDTLEHSLFAAANCE